MINPEKQVVEVDQAPVGVPDGMDAKASDTVTLKAYNELANYAEKIRANNGRLSALVNVLIEAFLEGK